MTTNEMKGLKLRILISTNAKISLIITMSLYIKKSSGLIL
jgi:hypothetical protein